LAPQRGVVGDEFEGAAEPGGGVVETAVLEREATGEVVAGRRAALARRRRRDPRPGAAAGEAERQGDGAQARGGTPSAA
jgi:hypothetical protein